MRLQLPRFAIQQYLALERPAMERHEYLDGVIYAMAGESLAHGRISVNLVMLLATQLKGRQCEVLTKDTKVLSGPDAPTRLTNRGLFSYPDLVVVCGEPEFLDDKRDVILNPKIIIEILSETTEAFDRGDKCKRYQMYNATLTDYVLVSQTEPLIERFSRQIDGGWLFHRHGGLEADVPLPTIECHLPLKDVYDRVVFSAES